MTTRWIVAVVVVLAAVPSAAYQLHRDSDGDVVRWQERVVLSVDSRLAQRLAEPRALEALGAALEQMRASAPGLDLVLDEGEDLEMGYDAEQPRANRNAVVALDDWPWAARNLAATLVTMNRRTNQIIDADIAFNVEEWRFRVLEGGARDGETNDVQNTFTHELGHALGLLHNDQDERAVMYPSAPPGETQKRLLGQDDRDGLLELYSAPLQAAQSEPRQAGCSAAGGGPLLGLGALLWSWLARRRRTAFALCVALPALGAAAEPTAREPTAAADELAIGEVVESRSSWAPGKLIVTDIEVKLVTCSARTCEKKTTTVRLVGGRVGDIEQVLAHRPVPTKGDVVLVSTKNGRKRLETLAMPGPVTRSLK